MYTRGADWRNPAWLAQHRTIWFAARQPKQWGPPSWSRSSSVRASTRSDRRPTTIGLQLLENSIATGAGLVALILALGPVSGAHFNPIVTLADRILGGAADSAVWRSATT